MNKKHNFKKLTKRERQIAITTFILGAFLIIFGIVAGVFLSLWGDFIG